MPQAKLTNPLVSLTFGTYCRSTLFSLPSHLHIKKKMKDKFMGIFMVYIQIVHGTIKFWGQLWKVP